MAKGYNEESFEEVITEIALRNGITDEKIRFEYDEERKMHLGITRCGIIFTGNSNSYRIGVRKYRYGQKRFESVFVPSEYATEQDRKMGIAIA